MTSIRRPGSGGPPVSMPKTDVATPARAETPQVGSGKPAVQLPRSGWTDSSKLQAAIDRARENVSKFQHPRLRWLPLPIRPPVGQPTLPPMAPRYGAPAPGGPGGVVAQPPTPPVAPRYGMPTPTPTPPVAPRYGMPMPTPTPGLPSLPPSIFNPPTPPVAPRYGAPAPRPGGDVEMPPLSPRYGMPMPFPRTGIDTEPRR